VRSNFQVTVFQLKTGKDLSCKFFWINTDFDRHAGKGTGTTGIWIAVPKTTTERVTGFSKQKVHNKQLGIDKLGTFAILYYFWY
jgi:hypothetical protein